MSAGRHNLIIEPGATFRLPLTWTDAGGLPVDLTGCSARLRAYPPTGGAAFLELSGDIGSGGAIEFTASAAQTLALTEKEGVYAVEVDHGGGVVTRLLHGAVDIVPVGGCPPRRSVNC